MADEIMTAPEEDQELFQLSNGRYIMDEAQSRVMFQIKEAQPEHSHPISGTGYSWDESWHGGAVLRVLQERYPLLPRSEKLVHLLRGSMAQGYGFSAGG